MPRSREAPITAIDRGSKKRATAAAAAIRSRSSKRSIAWSENEVGNRTWIEPGAEEVSTGKPLSRKTSIIRWFSGSTSASNVVIPASSASSAR